MKRSFIVLRLSLGAPITVPRYMTAELALHVRVHTRHGAQDFQYHHPRLLGILREDTGAEQQARGRKGQAPVYAFPSGRDC